MFDFEALEGGKIEKVTLIELISKLLMIVIFVFFVVHRSTRRLTE